ncbi:sporulation initiation phosphotransferase F [Halobacillus andaensis]|uniref:Sporulation initiation phosphotransferase F n=1 Tax=Halobacillus andaensis TaxID=1176239 RepID=A0A917B4T6_HALAA|nr:response regulator [Halobacillus andaensis]MBP2004430.1 two-component system response regulator (stage 0 sporulation protein F) [Halobacillus andaensis]GGF21702.1 sporulation initiation phosphotransferase F [Halobacillus andaensis]
MGNKVLVVDDQPGIRLLLEELLKSDGYEIITAKTGKQACEQVIEHHPDLILMDYKLPLMSGGEVLEYLHNQNIHQPVLIMTGLSPNSIQEDTDYSFVKEIIPKPFDIHMMRDLVAKTISKEKL